MKANHTSEKNYDWYYTYIIHKIVKDTLGSLKMHQMLAFLWGEDQQLVWQACMWGRSQFSWWLHKVSVIIALPHGNVNSDNLVTFQDSREKPNWDFNSGLCDFKANTFYIIMGCIQGWREETIYWRVSEWVSEVAQSCPTLCDPMDTRLLCQWDFLVKSTGVGCLFLLQGTSQPRDRTQVSCIVDRRFTVWATRDVIGKCRLWQISCPNDKFTRSSEEREIPVAVFTFTTRIKATAHWELGMQRQAQETRS